MKLTLDVRDAHRWVVENGDPFRGKYHRISACGTYRLAKCMVRDSWVYVLSRGKDRIKVGSKEDCDSEIGEVSHGK